MNHHEAFDAVRLVFHSDIPDALLPEVIEKAIRDHRDEMDSRRMSGSVADADSEK
jgi:hypothetical protein